MKYVYCPQWKTLGSYDSPDSTAMVSHNISATLNSTLEIPVCSTDKVFWSTVVF